MELKAFIQQWSLLPTYWLCWYLGFVLLLLWHVSLSHAWLPSSFLHGFLSHARGNISNSAYPTAIYIILCNGCFVFLNLVSFTPQQTSTATLSGESLVSLRYAATMPVSIIFLSIIMPVPVFFTFWDDHVTLLFQKVRYYLLLHDIVRSLYAKFVGTCPGLEAESNSKSLRISM